MSGGQAPYTLYFTLWLVLVASALVSRRLPIGKLVRMALAWVAIFASGFLIFWMFRS